ncbi:MAG: hypothetical protein LC656_02710, partial [Sphingomonadales bacterium]|nr:hypothetical protein [Sphingomonadales bacterium]
MSEGSGPSATRIIESDLIIAASEIVSVLDPDLFTPNGSPDPDRPLYVYASPGGTAVFVNHGTVEVRLAVGTSGWLHGFEVAPGSATSAQALFDNASDGSFLVDSLWTDPDGNVSLGFTSGFHAPGPGILFRNEGRFEVRAAAGNVFGHWSAGAGGSAPFVNSGTFIVTSPYRSMGVFGVSSSPFENSGSITVQGGVFAEGVHWNNTIGSHFDNRGSITVSTDLNSPNPSIGLFQGETQAPAAGGFTIANSGTIYADIAIMVADFTASTLIADTVHNSGSIFGDVLLSFGDDIVENSGLMT